MTLPSKHDRLFVVLLASLAAVRIALLLSSQRSLLGDEATVGLMAKHIAERGDRPIFAYNADYNGGSALTAYLATIPFALFGISELALKAVPLAFSLAALVAVYAFVRSCRDARSAFVAALVYGTSVSLMKWSFDARGAYAECQALVPLAFWLLRSRCLSAGARLADDLLLGFVCGFGVYLLETFVPVAVTVVLFLLLRGRLSGGWRGLPAWGAGFLAGCAPLLLLGRGAESLHPLPLLRNLGRLPVNLWETLTTHLPGTMAYDNQEGFPSLRLVPNGLEYGFLIVAVGTLVVLRRDALASFWSALRRPASTPPPVPVEAILLAHVAIYLLLFSLHPLAGEDARHLLFLEPSLSMLAGLGLAAALERGALTWAAAILLTVALADRGWQHVRLMGDDALYGPLGKSSPRTADAMITFLESRGADHVLSEDWDLSWRIVFKTRERIVACHLLDGLHGLSDEDLRRTGRYAVIVGADTPKDAAVGRRLSKRGVVERYVVAGKAVYLFGAPAGSGQAPGWCPAEGGR